MLVNGRFLTRAPTGVDRFAHELLGALARRRGRPLRVAVPAASELPARSELLKVGRRAGNAWEQIDLPRVAAGDPLINLCNSAPLARENQLVVIHDAGSFANAANYSRAFRAWYRVMHASLMRRARVVATVSRFSAGELNRLFPARRRALEVIPEGGEHILRTGADRALLRRLGLEGRRYVLAVGSHSPNKNFRAVLQALRLLDDKDLLCVAVGRSNPRVFAPVELQDERLCIAGAVGDAELRALYEAAACFVFPSYYEGFGLPPLEAMCCGCPVVVSDRASLPEVCGQAALYCKAEDPATLAAALRRLLASRQLRGELRQAGHERSVLFNWDQAARRFDALLNAYFTDCGSPVADHAA